MSVRRQAIPTIVQCVNQRDCTKQRPPMYGCAFPAQELQQVARTAKNRLQDWATGHLKTAKSVLYSVGLRRHNPKCIDGKISQHVGLKLRLAHSFSCMR